jgi:gliding motility-associated-like protein
MQPRVLIIFFMCSILFWLKPYGASGQNIPDTIAWSSTCVNSSISFSSPILNSFLVPDYISWHFGDPGSGYNDSSGGKSPVHVYTSPGTYFVSLSTLYQGGDTTTVRDTITIVTPMAYNFGPDIYVCGKNPDTVLRGPVIPGATYTWNDDSTTHADTVHITVSGVYTVAVNGCGVKDSIGVFASDTPQIKLGKDHIMCDSSNLLLNAASQNGTYTWYLNGAVLPFTGDQLLTQYPGGTYVASVSVPGCGVYGDTVSITYAQPLAPAFSLGGDTLLCPDQVYTLSANLSGASAYDWSTGAATQQITVTDNGTYWVFVTYNGQCQVTDTVNITYRNDKPLDFHDTAICKGSTLVLDADFGEGVYNWTATPPQRNDQNQSGQSTYYVYEPGMYKVVATVGQCVWTDSLTVAFDDSLQVTMLKDTTLCNGEDFLLQVKGNADTLTWQDGSMGNPYHPTQSGIYTVIAANGCGRDTLTATVDFTACGCQLNLPNAFTPNGDGRNDNFRPLHVCDLTDFEMNIYDRYGDLVFRSLNADEAWDGTYRGIKAPGGTYVWMVHYFSTATKQPVMRKGTVMLIR